VTLDRDLLLSLLRESSTPATTVVFPQGGGAITGAELWERAGEIGRAVRALLPSGGSVAMHLQPSAASVAGLFGAWRAGCTAVSLPGRPATTTAADHGAQVAAALEAGAVDAMLLAPSDDALRQLTTVPILDLDRPDGGARLTRLPDAVPPIGLVQFSSGSTGTPKGICLRSVGLASNIIAIVDATGPPTRVEAYSWLPLSHDMGLLGMLLSSYVAAGPRYRGGGRITIEPPSAFTRNPARWLRLCAELGATVTAGPPTAYRQAFRRIENDAVDLSALECCIIGAEPISADVLREVELRGRPLGLRSDALRPSYGMAEMGVAVSITPPGGRWTSVEVDPEALDEGRVRDAPGGREVVGCGPPVPGVDVRIDAPPGQVGVVHVAGTALFSHYIGDAVGDPARWHATSDLGFVLEGILHITGRSDDMLIVAGRNLLPEDIEGAAASVPGVRDGCVAAVANESDKYALVAVLDRGVRGDEAGAVAQALRRALARSGSATPSTVVFVPLRSFLRTSSGKIRRRDMRTRLAAGDLPTALTFSFGQTDPGSVS
jgi:acyl-CoA synthetase (AMP-forming)/AMP-acid ligase II